MDKDIGKGGIISLLSSMEEENSGFFVDVVLNHLGIHWVLQFN